MKRILWTTLACTALVLTACSNMETKSDQKNTQSVQTDSEVVQTESANAIQTEDEQLLALCEDADTRYYEALYYSMKECDFSDCVAEDALNEYKTKALQKEIRQRQDAGLDQMTFETKYEMVEEKEMEEDIYYLKLNTIRKFSDGSECGSNIWFLVKNENGEMKIIDWNDNRMDSVDSVLGENREPQLPVVWENEAWTQNVLQKISK